MDKEKAEKKRMLPDGNAETQTHSTCMYVCMYVCIGFCREEETQGDKGLCMDWMYECAFSGHSCVLAGGFAAASSI